MSPTAGAPGSPRHRIVDLYPFLPADLMAKIATGIPRRSTDDAARQARIRASQERQRERERDRANREQQRQGERSLRYDYLIHGPDGCYGPHERVDGEGSRGWLRVEYGLSDAEARAIWVEQARDYLWQQGLDDARIEARLSRYALAP